MSEKATTPRETPQISKVEVLAAGLDSPRKMSFGPDGALYVAEARRGGSGASIPSASVPGASFFYGATGAITQIQNGVAEQIVTRLPSLALPDGSDAAGVSDIEFDADGNAYAIVGLGSDPANRDTLLQVPDFSQLIAIDSFENGGSWTRLRDFGAYEQINNFTHIVDLEFDDAGGLYVLEYDANELLNEGDAGALIYVSTDGKTRTTIADDELTNPTGLEIGSDGNIYISNKGFVAGQGEVLRLSLKEGTSFNPEPLYDEVNHYTTSLAADGDPADIYYPVVPNSTTDQLPIVLMLQGALVDKADYSKYAEEVASYEFVVVVPNNERTLTAPDGQTVTGLFSEQGQVNDVLDQMRLEDADPTSPIFEIADTKTLGLPEHWFGGAVGLGATQEEICIPGICSEDDTIPPELQVDIFYGTNFRDQQTGEFLPINNEDIPVGLIAGTLDSVSNFGAVASTYDNVQDPPKALIVIEGANHYGITNADNLIREANRPTLDQATATRAIRRWSGLFLRSHLLGERGAFDYVYNTGDNFDPNVSVISQTPLS